MKLRNNSTTKLYNAEFRGIKFSFLSKKPCKSNRFFVYEFLKNNFRFEDLYKIQVIGDNMISINFDITNQMDLLLDQIQSFVENEDIVKIELHRNGDCVELKSMIIDSEDSNKGGGNG